ncbi:response regulator [Leptolyngbya sp. FACHB-17]|uniref:ATP-binding response regulator n=1 Tax=Leptolyngbyales TaxID=3079749 RepID=UPI0016805F51|nr:response regulator [Leptolyngbya sp. FACHB-17]MBD2082882.1 response regulator [Leptolyngbya sp. FACHB-17]
MLHILFVDDNRGDRLLAIRELRKNFPDLQAIEIGTADGLASALETGEFDAVVTDYQLLWSDGLSVLQAIKSRYPNCPVIMFTNSGSEEIAVKGMKQGLSDYVLKGQPLYRLTVAVQESLEKQRMRREYDKTVEQLKLSEERFRQQAKELAEANQLRDEFLAVISHELRTPLNPILGWVQVLRKGTLSATQVDHALETIERNAKLQTQLIEDLLDISRILRGKLSLKKAPVDLGHIIGASLETVRLAIEAKHIQVETHLAPRGQMVFGDAGRLQQVIWNLLSNAVKFTPESGKIEIDLNYVNLKAQITVKDTGIGISSEFLPYVFEYFRQADSSITRNFGGLGLGLAIARQITELHGGTIRAESLGEGEGTTFTVTLPLMTTVSETAEQITPADNTSGLQAVKVLVVDDEPDNLDLIAFVLADAGATVTAVASAGEALAVLPQFRPDVLVSDIGMPEMNGYELARQAQASLPPGESLPAIALTAYAGEADQERALAAGFRVHLSKPVEPVDLIRSIVELVRSKPSP